MYERCFFPKALEMSSYHDHKVALVVICYIATVSNHLWKQHLSAVHVQTPFFGTSFTLYIESVSCLWLWDCSLSLVQPKWGEWPLPSLGFLISHLGPDMFNRVHICLLTQWVVVPLLPLHLFFFAQKKMAHIPKSPSDVPNVFWGKRFSPNGFSM